MSTVKVSVVRFTSAKKNAFTVKFSIDHQTFNLNLRTSRRRAAWTARMLRIALKRLQGRA